MIEFLLQLTNGTFHFHSRYVTLGRNRSCGLVLPDRSVMPVHAALVEEQGRLYLEKQDLDALTFLNRAPIHRRAEVFDGDMIDIGPWTIVLRSTELGRRDVAPADWTNEIGVTPSDMTIVRRVTLHEKFDASHSTPDDSSSSFII